MWRIIQKNSNESSIRKNKMIVNIRKLNKIIKSNIYLMSLQTNVIVLMIECFYISIFDAINFFHQWLIQITNRYKLIVISHKNQKQFNVAIMSFKNSSIYVQRKINVILRVYKIFVKVYVNDIIMFNKILKKHLFHLRQIFELLNFFDIRFSFKKSYLNYFIVTLLKQKVDVFDLTIVVDKLTIIANLRFSYILKNLKKYLSFIDWFRNYIVWYVQKFDVLQKRKILLLRSSSTNKERQRKMYFAKIVLKKFIETEYEFYRQLQKVFRQISLLMYHDSTRIIYINVNVFKRRDFDVVIYHLKNEIDSNNFKHDEIEFILFLNRMLTFVEERYWSIELKMIELMWIIRRARHFIKVFRHVTIIFIDHVVNASIVKQTIFTFNNTNKLNLRLIRVFIYLFQFRLNIRYRFDKRHVISNVFFKLSIDKSFLNESENLNLKNYHDRLKDFFVNHQCLTYNDMLINMLNVFRQQLIDDYVKKKFWTELIVMLINLVKRIDLKKFFQSLKVNFNQQSKVEVIRSQTSSKFEVIRNHTSKTFENQSSIVIRNSFKKRKNIFNTLDEIFDHQFKKKDVYRCCFRITKRFYLSFEWTSSFLHLNILWAKNFSHDSWRKSTFWTTSLLSTNFEFCLRVTFI